MYKPKQARIISFIQSMKHAGRVFLDYLAHIRYVEVESPSMEFIRVVSEFREVYITELPHIVIDVFFEIKVV